jgi:hypothetical protein
VQVVQQVREGANMHRPGAASNMLQEPCSVGAVFYLCTDFLLPLPQLSLAMST